MTELHGICAVGIVDMKHHTVVVKADLITIARGYGIEMKPLLPPPYTSWLFMYDSDGKRILDADNNVIRLPRE